jgi:2-iminobutanoate/2-iminopropanoate deaminase
MPIEKDVVRFGPFARFIANGVRVGDTLYLSGQISIDDEGEVVGADDPSAQVAQAYEHVKSVLARYGATMDNVVDETWFVSDIERMMSEVDSVFAARLAAYGGAAEVTQTMVQVAALAMPELLIEIKCVAKL